MKKREYRFPCKAFPSRGRGSRGHSLLPMEGGVPKGRRLDGDSGMKESEEMHLKSTINESTLSTAARSPFPNREGKEEAASPQKKKPTPPRCARQPLPREGARVVIPSFLFPPSYGRRCPEGAEVGWGKRDERERGDHIRSTIHESTLCKNNL